MAPLTDLAPSVGTYLYGRRIRSRLGVAVQAAEKVVYSGPLADEFQMP